MKVDFLKNPSIIAPLVINNSESEVVQYFKFLVVYIPADPKWETNIDLIVNKAQKRLFFRSHIPSVIYLISLVFLQAFISIY